MKMQMDLLRVLETKQFSRLGAEKTITTDFRVISATNRDLEQAVKDGNFREDLYFRLNVFTILLPPLRERDSDIEQLAGYFLKRIAKSMNKPVKEFTDEALEAFGQYSWPGNVRELRNVIERAIVVSKGDVIERADLSFPFTFEDCLPAVDSLDDVERLHIQRILNKTGWNVLQAAKLLGIDRSTLYAKIKKYDLSQ